METSSKNGNQRYEKARVPRGKKKGKDGPTWTTKPQRGKKCTAPITHNISARCKLRGQIHAPVPLPRRKETLYRTELWGWAGPRPGLDDLEISWICPDSKPGIVQPIAQSPYWLCYQCSNTVTAFSTLLFFAICTRSIPSNTNTRSYRAEHKCINIKGKVPIQELWGVKLHSFLTSTLVNITLEKQTRCREDYCVCSSTLLHSE
jgi:hypothetical protein